MVDKVNTLEIMVFLMVENVNTLAVLVFVMVDKVNTLEKSLAEGRTTLNEQKVLITQLEEDLRNVNAFSSMFRGVAEVYLYALLLSCT